MPDFSTSTDRSSGLSGESGIQRWLRGSSETTLASYCVAAAFGTYFCMYAFRKPFTAATYEDVTLAGLVSFKAVLVAAQLCGYTLSKFIGIKVVSEMPANRRAMGILILILIAEFALLGFALIPPPWNLVMLFINGLPLGMVFGLVLAFLEGRRTTEALAAGLCASFIISSGVVKSVGRWLIVDQHVPEFWMPFCAGLIFAPALLVSVWMLSQIPAPSPEDIVIRRERRPMSSKDRMDFVRHHGLGLGLLIVVFVLLTVIRSFRDDFAVEIWQQLPGQEAPDVFSRTETLIAFVVVIVNGLAITIKGNRAALLGSLALITAGFMIVLGALAGHVFGWLSPFSFMVLVGLGMYIPYVAYHTTIFERLIASVQQVANVGYLMYLADAIGYLGYVAVVIYRNAATGGETDYLKLFNTLVLVIGVTSLALSFVLIAYFYRKLPAAVAEPGLAVNVDPSQP